MFTDTALAPIVVPWTVNLTYIVQGLGSVAPCHSQPRLKKGVVC